MLASFFVINGVKTVLKPEPLLADAEPIVEKVVPLAQRVAPPSVAGYIPEDTQTLVRLTGAAQVLGGLSLATGLGRQMGAAILAASMVPHVIASRPSKNATADERATSRSIMLRNIALLGAAVIASQDTEGKPSLAWRANDAGHRLAGSVDKQKKALAKDAGKLNKAARKQAKDARKQIESTFSN